MILAYLSLLLKKYWKLLIIVASIISFLGFVYFSGKREAHKEMKEAAQKEVIKRERETKKEQDKVNKRKDKIREDRKTRPRDDKRDSCILSNDPIKADCL